MDVLKMVDGSCCRNFKVGIMTVTILNGAFDLILITGGVLGYIYRGSNDALGMAILGLVSFLLTICLHVGAFKNNREFLVVWMFLKMMLLVVQYFLGITAIIVGAVNISRNKPSETQQVYASLNQTQKNEIANLSVEFMSGIIDFANKVNESNSLAINVNLTLAGDPKINETQHSGSVSTQNSSQSIASTEQLFGKNSFQEPLQSNNSIDNSTGQSSKTSIQPPLQFNNSMDNPTGQSSKSPTQPPLQFNNSMDNPTGQSSKSTTETPLQSNNPNSTGKLSNNSTQTPPQSTDSKDTDTKINPDDDALPNPSNSTSAVESEGYSNRSLEYDASSNDRDNEIHPDSSTKSPPKRSVDTMVTNALNNTSSVNTPKFEIKEMAYKLLEDLATLVEVLHLYDYFSNVTLPSKENAQTIVKNGFSFFVSFVKEPEHSPLEVDTIATFCQLLKDVATKSSEQSLADISKDNATSRVLVEKVFDVTCGKDDKGRVLGGIPVAIGSILLLVAAFETYFWVIVKRFYTTSGSYHLSANAGKGKVQDSGDDISVN